MEEWVVKNCERSELSSLDGHAMTFEEKGSIRILIVDDNKSSRDILEELEQGRSVHQERDDKTQVYKWGATREGVAFWIKTTDRIPAGIVQVASISASVSDLEVK